MSAKEIYQYVYYKIYKVMDGQDFNWAADFRASLFLEMFECLTLFSIMNYYSYISGNVINDALFWGIIVTVFLFLWGAHYKYFHDIERRTALIAKFDEWPTKKNLIGTIIVWGALMILIINCIVSFKLYAAKFLN